MAARRDTYLTSSSSVNPPRLQLPISPLDVEDAPLEASRSTLQPFRRRTRPLSSNGLPSFTPTPALASTSSFRPLSLDLPSASAADWDVDLAYDRPTHVETQASTSSHVRRARSSRQRYTVADSSESSSSPHMSVASARASTSHEPTDIIESTHHRHQYEGPSTIQSYNCDRLELPTYVSESFKRSFEAEATLSPPCPRRRLSVSSFLSTSSSPLLSPSSLSSPTDSSFSIPVLPELNLPSASSSRSELDHTFSTTPPEASPASMAAASFASTDTLSDISDSSRRTSSLAAWLPGSSAPESRGHAAVRSDSRNSLTLQLDSPVSESWIESFYDEALQRNADFARSHSPPTPSDSRRPKRRRSTASDENIPRSRAIDDHLVHRAHESTLSFQSRQSLHGILPSIDSSDASANNLSEPYRTADDIEIGSGTSRNIRLSAGHPPAQMDMQFNTHPQVDESSSMGQALTTEVESPLLPEIAATTPLEEAEPPLMRYISGFLRQPQPQERSSPPRDLAQNDEPIASSPLRVRPVSVRRGSTQRFSLGVLPAFHFEESPADTTSLTEDSSSIGLAQSPSNDQSEASVLAFASHASPVHSTLPASPSASFRRPHLQRNTTAVSPPEESPTYSPGLERQGMFTVDHGLRRMWQYGGHRRSTHHASGLDISESHDANTSRAHRMTLPAEPPRLSLDFADMVDSEDHEQIGPDVRHGSHSSATRHSRFDISGPAVPHSSPGTAIAGVRSPTAAAAHHVVSPSTIDDTAISASTVQSVYSPFGSARPVPPGSERRRAEQLLSRLEFSRRIASEVQDLQQARLNRPLASSSRSTSSLLPTPRRQAALETVSSSSLLSDRDTPQASESRRALQIPSRAPGHSLLSEAPSRSVPQDSGPPVPSASVSAATIASQASDPAPPNHLWGEVGSPSRLTGTSSMAAAVQLPASSQARRPGSLGNSNMRGPTRVSNESWMRGQGINFYDSDGRRPEAAAPASAVASIRANHAINRVRAPPSSPAQSPEMASPEQFASNASDQPSNQAAHSRSVTHSDANQRSLPGHPASRTPEVARVTAARPSLPSHLSSANETIPARELSVGSSQTNAAVVGSSRPIRNQNRRDAARDLAPLGGTLGNVIRISESHSRLATSHVDQMAARRIRRGSSSAIPSNAPRSTPLRDERASFSGSRSSRHFRGPEVPAVSDRIAPVAYNGRRSSASSNRSIREWFQWETDIQPPSNLDDSVFEGDEEEDLHEEQQSTASITRATQPYERFEDHVAEANEGIAAALRRLDNVRRLLDEVEENMQTRRRDTGSSHLDPAVAMDQASQVAAVTRSMAQVEEQGQDLLRRISALRSERQNASPSVSTTSSIDTGPATSLDTPPTITLSRPGPAAFASASTSSSSRRSQQIEEPVIESRSRRVRPRSTARPAFQPFDEIFAEVEAEFSQRDRRRRAVERLPGSASASSRLPSTRSYPTNSSSGQRPTSLSSPALNETPGSFTTGGLAPNPADALDRLDFWDNALSFENDVFSWSDPHLPQSSVFTYVSPLARLRDARGGSTSLGGIAGEPGNYISDSEFDVSYESLLALSERVGEVKERGASSAAMHTSLSLFRYVKFGATQSGSAEQETRCGICLEDYVEQDACARSNRCGHALHEVCFSAWLRRNDTCPICRQHAV